MKKRILAFIGGVVTALILTVGLRLLPAVGQSSALLVSAAASLQNALEELNPQFEQANSGVEVNYNFAASGALQQQIEQGAPADVFLSAANKQMQALADKGLILTDTRRALLTNQLVLIVPADSTLNLTGFRELAQGNVQKISVGEPGSVPAGQYAEQVFKSLEIFEQVKPKLVYASNVRGVLSAVESGNVDAGIVYATDAKLSSQVRQVATAPARLHDPIVYPVAVLKDSKNPQAARRYVEFLTGNQATALFKKYGFGIASSVAAPR